MSNVLDANVKIRWSTAQKLPQRLQTDQSALFLPANLDLKYCKLNDKPQPQSYILRFATGTASTIMRRRRHVFTASGGHSISRFRSVATLVRSSSTNTIYRVCCDSSTSEFYRCPSQTETVIFAFDTDRWIGQNARRDELRPHTDSIILQV